MLKIFNRKQKRKLEKKGYTKEQIKQVEMTLNPNDDDSIFKEGESITVKVDEILQQKKLSKKYLSFIQSCRDKIFTIEYDKKSNNKHMLCLKEDETKWLIWEGYLQRV